jgi:hypothetical protein
VNRVFRLSATLELFGGVVHDVSLPVGEGIWLGDHPEAAVVFPGALLHVAPYGPAAERTVSVAGGSSPVLLRPGGSLRIELEEGAALQLSLAETRRLPREELPAGDIRLLVLTAALVLFGVWWETASRWADRNPDVVAEVAAVMLGDRSPAETPSDPRDTAPDRRLLEPVAYTE